MTKPKQPAGEAGNAPEISVDDMHRLAGLRPGDAVRMEYEAAELRQVAARAEARGDRVGPKLDRAKADRLTRDAALALDPGLHTTGPVTVGNGGEVAIGTKVMAPFVDMVRAQPDMLVIDASRQRMELADNAGGLSMALDASATVGAANSLEKMLMHQAAAAHVASMEFQAEARDVLRAYKRTGHAHAGLSVEATRLLNASARMMDSYQHALLTLERLRNGGKQVVVVQHVTVGDGGQAVVAGQVKAAGGRRGGAGGGG